MTPPVLTTERLVLRPLRMEDHAAYRGFVTSARARFMGGPFGSAIAWNWLTNDVAQWQLEGFGGLAVTRDGTMVGQVSVTRGLDFPEPELGWFLLEGHEGRGYATEAAASLRDFVLDKRLVTSLVSYIDARNVASARLATRLGARRDPDAAMPAGTVTEVWRHPVAAAAGEAAA